VLLFVRFLFDISAIFILIFILTLGAKSSHSHSPGLNSGDERSDWLITSKAFLNDPEGRLSGKACEIYAMFTRVGIVFKVSKVTFFLSVALSGEMIY
jgi:hypothetical protein